MAAGSIDFDRVEVKFEIDEKGKPLSVYFKESKEANKLIEEFMLLANRTVAEHVGKVPKNKKPKVLPSSPASATRYARAGRRPKCRARSTAC